MRVIIAGGSGLIGSELAVELTQSGHEVIILSRNPAQKSGLPGNIQIVGWDGKTSQGWRPLLVGVEAIVNLAGENIAGENFFPTKWSEARKDRIRQSRLEAGQAILEAIRTSHHKPEVLIQSSAIGYYGPLGDQAVDENYPAGTDFLARLCQEWEDSTKPVELMGMRRAIARTGVVLSVKGGALKRLLLPFKLFAGGPLGSGRQYLSWIHIADEVAAIRFLIENKEAHGVFNLTAPSPVTNRELSKIIGRIMKRPSFIPVPSFLFKFMFGEVTTVVLDGQRVLPIRLQALGFKFQFTQADLAIINLLKN